MTLNYEKIITLSSMGIVKDNIDIQADDPQIVFVPDSDCMVFVPSIAKIRSYVVTTSGTTYTDAVPDVHTLYLNAISLRLYSWNGENMMLLLNTGLGMEQIVDALCFNEPNQVYHVTTVRQLSSPLEIGEGSTVVFHGQGKFAGAPITGLNIQFIPDGEKVCFGTGCSFSNISPRASWLRATNFGAVPDMTIGPSHSWTFFDLTCDIQERYGTNNESIWGTIGGFLSHSINIKLEFNGEFYSDNIFTNSHNLVLHNPQNDKIKVERASNLELKSATRFVNLNDNSDGTVTVTGNVVSCNQFIYTTDNSQATVTQSGNVVS